MAVNRSAARKLITEPRPRPAEPRSGEIATNLDRLLHTTDGNLSVHARKLEEAGYVSCAKTFAGRTPRTDYKLTAAGRRALEKYLDHMDALNKAARRT